MEWTTDVPNETLTLSRENSAAGDPLLSLLSLCQRSSGSLLLWPGKSQDSSNEENSNKPKLNLRYSACPSATDAETFFPSLLSSSLINKPLYGTLPSATAPGMMQGRSGRIPLAWLLYSYRLPGRHLPWWPFLSKENIRNHFSFSVSWLEF